MNTNSRVSNSTLLSPTLHALIIFIGWLTANFGLFAMIYLGLRDHQYGLTAVGLMLLFLLIFLDSESEF